MIPIFPPCQGKSVAVLEAITGSKRYRKVQDTFLKNLDLKHIDDVKINSV